MKTISKRQVSIIHAAYRRGFINITPSFLDKLYRLTSNSEGYTDQIIVDRALQAIDHIFFNRYELAQAVLDGKKVEYSKISTNQVRPKSTDRGIVFVPIYKYDWVIKEV